MSGVVDAVGGDDRDLHRLLEVARRPGEAAARHGLRDGRNARLVPADPGVEQRRARLLDRLGDLRNLLGRKAAFHELERGDAVDEDEVLACGRAARAHHLDRQAHAVLEASAPLVLPLVRARREELRDEIALRAHHLDAVVARFARERRARGERGDDALDVGGVELARRVRVDSGPDGRGRDDVLVKAVAPRVQQLQRDAPARVVHRARDRLVPLGVRGRAHLRRVGTEVARGVGREAARDDQRRAAPGALGVERGEPRNAIRPRLQARMHRAHEDPVGQRGEAQVKRSEQVRIHNWGQTSFLKMRSVPILASRH